MDQTVRVFDEGWRMRVADDELGDSWAYEVIADLNGNGGRYLEILALWFGRFPVATKKQRCQLKARLESLSTSDHLGVVNELSWYQFMCDAGLQASPIPTTNTPRPDFRVMAPADFFVEVSTLNGSEAERNSLLVTGGVNLNHHATLRRLLVKAADEKDAQIAHAASEGKPCLLVLFDYTFWSGLATDCFHFLATGLLGGQRAFAQLPVALSAIAYVERRVLGGRIAISQRRSAIYYNPAAAYPLAPGSFDLLSQFRLDINEIKPKAQEDWIWL
ncbi:MAG: hypothetical protein HOP00_07395 [Nitrospira sp.]|nr:hypothetical protein [Nitrospira sp.]